MGAMKVWNGVSWEVVSQQGPAGPMQGAHAPTHYAGGTDPLTGKLPLKVGAGTMLVGHDTANALTGDYNTALGVGALKADSTGAGNVGAGYLAGDAITTGNNNIAIGNQADVASPTTSQGIAIGTLANAADNALAMGKAANAAYAGSVAIGVDSVGAAASAYGTDSFVLGTSRHTVTAPGLFTAHNGIDWFQLNMQTGVASVTTNGSGDWSCVFGRAFAATPYFVIPIDQNGNHYVHSLTGINPSLATFRSTQAFNGVIINTAIVVRWIAFGPK